MLALYNPVSNAQKKPIVPYSLLAVGAVAEGRLPWALVDGNLEADAVQRLDRILSVDDRPILGVTTMPGPQVVDAVPVVAELKRRHPRLRTLWGGYFPTQHAHACLKSPLVDVVVRGHPDLSLPTILDVLNAPELDLERLRGVPGVSFRDGDGFVDNPTPAVPKVANLPPLPFHKIPLERYVRPTVLGRRTLGYHSSYGCPFVCNFCAVVSMVDGRYSSQTSDTVVEAVRTLQKRFGLDAIEFYDNNFFVSEKRCREFAEAIDPLRIAWWGEGRIDTLTGFSDDTWQKMADSGLRMIFMGAESGSLETLKRMDKGGTVTPEQTLALCERMGRFGVIPELSFVLGSPPDPRADVEGTLEFIRTVKQVNPAAEIILYLYTPEPVEGKLWDDAQAAGFRWPDTLEGWADPEVADVVQRRSDTLPWIENGLRKRVKDFERVLNAAHPTTTDPRLTGIARTVLKGIGYWRWSTRTYARPYELQALDKLIRYRRPETSGF